MALPTAPDDLAWRNHGHTFDSLPANVKAHVHGQLEIPKEYERALFPNPQLSIIDFVHTFTPPPACPDQKQNMYQLPTGHSFFQTGLPDLGDILALIRIMVPPKRIIAELLKEAKQKWLDGYSSLSVLGEALLIPLWVLSFWTRILFDILPVHRDWQICLEWLQHDEFKLFQGQVQDAVCALSALPWSGYLSPMSSGTSSMRFLKSTLSPFLSHKWLSDENNDQMTYLLQKRVEESKSHPNVIFLSNQMGRRIVDLYLNEKSRKSKYNPDGEEYFQHFGARLQQLTQRTLGGTSSKVSKKRRREDSDNEENLNSKARQPKHIGSDESDTSDSLVAHNPGRPQIGLLDKFSVSLNTRRGEVQAHRCISKGCPKIYKPRSCIQVLGHAKRCLKLTSDQHKMASAASSKDAPSAIVDNSLKTLPFSSSPSQSCSPNEKAPQPASYQGELQGSVIVIHSSTPLTPSTPPVTDKLAFFGPRGRRVHHQALNAAVLKFICAARIAPTVVDLDEWKAMFLLQTPSYSPASQTTLMENHIMSEQEYVQKKQIELLKTKRNLSLSFDGGSIRSGESLYTVHITMEERCVMLIEGQECTNISHTGQWIADLVLSVMDLVGHDHFIAVSSDNTGNTRVARDILSKEVPLLLNLPDPAHHLNNTWKDIANLPYFKEKANHIFINENARLRFEILLVQFIEVGSGIARAIECLEAESATPANVYLYWLAILASMKQALEGSFLPDDVKGEIRGIMNTRWREFFVEGPTNVHLVAFYLNPSYVRSSIFKRPNPLTFNIILPGQGMPQVPPGINNPRTFLQVGNYLFHLLAIEIQKGTDPFLTAWKDKARQFDVAFRAQFTAYAQGAYPFTTPLHFGENPYNWWQAFVGTSNGGILAAIAVKLYAAVPHSMADERTMSSITLLNTAQRNRQQVPTVIAMAQINGYYKGEKPRKVRKSSRPNPLLKFFDIDRLLRSIENDDDDGKAAPDYDESEDEEDVVLRGKDEDPNAPLPPPPSSNSLLFDSSDDEIEIESEELEEILADAPAFRRIKKDRFAPVVEEVVEDGGEFKLGPWVQGVGK
ncbi:hypothetical protein NLJ89_g4557 [Agrocybe chaxingu]|uniref:DUF659 domain-containing protein n=1 Tax=Agrocybe chaxingu TaxID=84603 RepID=A0A9W8K2V3_9AGAR|nr:hypothetical protein NLJ89_g4557 [Agrocybe chaxingu]